MSNKYIEKIRFRNDFDSFFEYLNCKPVHLVLFVGTLGMLIFSQHGLSTRFSDEVQFKNKAAINAIGDWSYPAKYNLKVGNNNIRFIKGDSEKIYYLLAGLT